MFVSGVTARVDPPINDLWTVPGEEGRKTVELFTAIYRAQKERQPVRWPLASSPV